MNSLRKTGALAWALVALLVVASATMPAGAALDNKGTDFILSFTPNYAQDGVRQLHLASDVATSVTVEYPVNLPTFTTTVAVNPGAITVVDLPLDVTAWTPDTVQNNSIRAYANQEFIVYMHNLVQYSSDSALGLPVDTMNTEYIVSGFDEAFIGAQFVVTAAFDDTTVTITPKVDIVGHTAGSTFDVVLDRGQGFFALGTVFGAGNSSLSGSIVTADKPIGLTNGNGCTQVPIGVTACDTLMEVAQPTQTWGNEALVVNLPERPGGSMYRVVASQDGTNVTNDGAAVGTINRGDYLTIGPVAGNHVIAADKPIFVTQYMTGLDSPGATNGDPAMGNVVPTEQYLNAYTFSTAGAGQFAVHYLTVIANNADLATITLDGVAIGAGAFSAIGATGFSGALMGLAEGTHTTASTNPHGIFVAGLNSYDSYLYPGGALFSFINPVGDANPPLCPLTCDANHCDGVAQDNRPSEDGNGNDILDPGEDLNGNDQIDTDTGVFFVELAGGSSNLSLTVDPFVPGAGIVNFDVDATGLPASGAVIVTDGAGNTCRAPVEFGANELCGNDVVDAGEECDDGNTESGDGCSATCQNEGCEPVTEICDNQIDDDCDGLVDAEDEEDCADLYVELGGFSVIPDDGRVTLNWNTLAEIDNAGFYLLRRDVVSGRTVRVNPGLIPAQGDVFIGASYQFVDTTAVNGVQYEYALVDVDRLAKETRHANLGAIANPVNPRIQLLAPVYGTKLPMSGKTEFSWSSVSFMGGSIRISPDATFPADKTLAIALDARQTANGRLVLNRRQQLGVLEMATKSGGVLYWQIAGSAPGQSATFRFSYDLSDYAKSGVVVTTNPVAPIKPKALKPRLGR